MYLKRKLGDFPTWIIGAYIILHAWSIPENRERVQMSADKRNQHLVTITTFSKSHCLACWIIDPSFFEGDVGETVTVTAARYVRMMENLHPEIDHLQNRGDVWFQQDGATAQTAWISMAGLREMFQGRLISWLEDVPWPAHSMDLSVLDFFLWGYKKSCVQPVACITRGAEDPYRR